MGCSECSKRGMSSGGKTWLTCGEDEVGCMIVGREGAICTHGLHNGIKKYVRSLLLSTVCEHHEWAHKEQIQTFYHLSFHAYVSHNLSKHKLSIKYLQVEVNYYSYILPLSHHTIFEVQRPVSPSRSHLTK
jgi:hypothetical protein